MDRKKETTVQGIAGKKYTDIEELRKDLLDLANAKQDIKEQDVVTALDRFDMSDDDIDTFYEWMSNAGIDIISDNEEEELEDDDYLASESEYGDDSDEDEDSERNIVINYEAASQYTKVNDPVKMYLKEIGRVNLLKADEEIEIVAGIDLSDHIKNTYPVFSSLGACDVEADVIIVFCSAKAIDGLIEYSVKKRIPVVVCTTGLSEEQVGRIREASASVAVLKSANMSLGINMLLKLLKEAALTLAPAVFDM